jgi:4-amino-4-deoxy-L-arabinose transferase-like glycosyltransferase
MAAVIIVVYLHNALPYLTMMPRVNVDEPWLMERAYQVMQTGQPRQPMYGLDRPYLLQAGYPYLLAGWMEVFGVGIRQSRLLGVTLGLGVLLMVAVIGRRLLTAWAGACAALFLAVDSNFLGGVRNGRTDIPAVFFAAAALACYAIARDRRRAAWWWLSGACAGLAMLCHGNTFWVAGILGIWLLLDYGRRVFGTSAAWCVAGGLGVTVGPYAAIVLAHWTEAQRQVNAFVPERVPMNTIAGVLHQVAAESARYRTWYFGLVTNDVPNPLLLLFQVMTAAGVLWLGWRAFTRRGDAHGAIHVLTIVIGSVVVFAALVNNKVPVYMPHLLIGFSLAAGFSVTELAGIAAVWYAARRGGGNALRPFAVLVLLFIAGYGAAATAYYEKWYSSARRSELVPYERTAATLRALVPPGPKTVYGSPHFWTPFHADRDTRYLSYLMGLIGPESMPDDRPVYMLVDELQWLPDLTSRAPGRNVPRDRWVELLKQKCVLDAMALGTAYGTIGLYRCDGKRPPEAPTPRIIGDGIEYRIGDRTTLGPAELQRRTSYDDPRRQPGDSPSVSTTADGLRVAGTGWPGITTEYPATPGEAYLVRVNASGTRVGDLLYLGTWKKPQVLSLGGASSAGMATPLAHEPWFPGDRAFIATAPRVQTAIYSEAPRTDFSVASVEIVHLIPAAPAVAGR